MHCKICLKQHKKMMFSTQRVNICGICVRQLNDNNTCAQVAYDFYKEKLKIGINRRIEKDLSSDDPWRKNQALID